MVTGQVIWSIPQEKQESNHILAFEVGLVTAGASDKPHLHCHLPLAPATQPHLLLTLSTFKHEAETNSWVLAWTDWPSPAFSSSLRSLGPSVLTKLLSSSADENTSPEMLAQKDASLPQSAPTG